MAVFLFNRPFWIIAGLILRVHRHFSHFGLKNVGGICENRPSFYFLNHLYVGAEQVLGQRLIKLVQF